MAEKFLIFVLVAISSAFAAPAPASEHDPCICQTDINGPEVQGLWNFFKEVEPETISHPIIAGQLSPNVPCGNCVEYNRKKRKILPESEVITTVTEREGDVPVAVAEEDSVEEGMFHDRRCPSGMIRVSSWCVEADY